MGCIDPNDDPRKPSVHESVKECFWVGDRRLQSFVMTWLIMIISQERALFNRGSKVGVVISDDTRRASSQRCILHKMDLDGIFHAEPSHLPGATHMILGLRTYVPEQP